MLLGLLLIKRCYPKCTLTNPQIKSYLQPPFQTSPLREVGICVILGKLWLRHWFGVSKLHCKMKLVVFAEIKAIIVCCSCRSSKTASQTLSLSMTYYINYFCGMV